MVVGGRHIGGGGIGGGGGGDEGSGSRGRRSRANSPLVPPNGVLTPAGSQNMNSPSTTSTTQCSKLNDSLPPSAKGGDSTKPSDALLKSAESVKTASGTLGGGGGIRSSLSPVPHSHHAPPIDPDLRSKNNSGDHLISMGGGSASASGISHHASHHLLPPTTPLHHHHHHHGPDSDSDAESDSGLCS